MKQWLKDKFHLTSRERSGTLVLIVLCVFFLGLPRYYQLFWQPAPPDYEKFERLLSRWAAMEGDSLLRGEPAPGTTEVGREGEQTRQNKMHLDQRRHRDETTAHPVSLFTFDPNQSDEAAFLRLGLSPRVVRNLLKYRESGGVFRKKEDLQKIYGITDATYRRLEPYLAIAQPSKLVPHEEKALRVDVNRATAEEWAGLYGIGPVLSQRIVRFREKLGGFAHVDQVAETYGLPDTTYQKIKPYLDLSPVLQKLPLNSGSAEALAGHPYLNARQTRALVAFRTNHGPFRSVADLARAGALDDKTIEKIRPYLDFSTGRQESNPDR